MTKTGEHTHSFKKVKYINLPVTNDSYNGNGKRVLKLLLCDCGRGVGKDLLDKMPTKGNT